MQCRRTHVRFENRWVPAARLSNLLQWGPIAAAAAASDTVHGGHGEILVCADNDSSLCHSLYPVLYMYESNCVFASALPRGV